MAARVAFYAPEAAPILMEPREAATVARHMIAALRRAGVDVVLASRYTPGSDMTGSDGTRRARLGERFAHRIARRIAALPPAERPKLFISLRVNGGAPDLIGPHLARASGIPYVVIRAGIAASDPLGTGDGSSVIDLGEGPGSRLPLFVDTSVYARTPPEPMRPAFRAMVGNGYGLDPGIPWIVAPAAMHACRRASFQMLADALGGLGDRAWQLVVVGDGPDKAAVAEMLFPLGFEHVRLVGSLRGGDLAALFAAADLCAWPALGEALALAGLETQAAGLPVVACAGSGAAGYVREGDTGYLAASGDVDGFARHVAALIDDDNARRRMGARARANTVERHALEAAAPALARALGLDAPHEIAARGIQA
ncbi:MAG: glycosyltransferase family 4 protein [Alphaproteobacteria bacterium]